VVPIFQQKCELIPFQFFVHIQIDRFSCVALILLILTNIIIQFHLCRCFNLIFEHVFKKKKKKKKTPL